MKIVIASGKGGTGKTTLATNLAAYLSRTREVVLSDLDVEEPNSGLFLNGHVVAKLEMFKQIPHWTGACSLCGLCQDVCAFNAVLRMGDAILVDPQLCHSCYACSELCPENALPMRGVNMGWLTHMTQPRLEIIESRLNVGEEQAVPLIRDTQRYLDESFSDAMMHIIDAPPGTSCPVIEAVRSADFVLLVTEPTPFGLHDLDLMVGVVRQLGRPCGVVINREGSGNNDIYRYCREQDLEIIAAIPNDRRIAETYSRGELLFDVFPQVRNALDRIIDYLELAPEAA